MFEQLKAVVSPLVQFNEMEWEEVLSYFTPLNVPKNTQLLKLGKVAPELYFINKGAIRTYYLYDVEELNEGFYFENSFVSAFTSFFRQTPSKEVVETMEDSQLLVIKKSDYEKLNHTILKFNIIGRKIAEGAMLRREHHRSTLTLDSPKKRYQRVKQEEPWLLSRIPQQYLASYLDIPLLHLSKMIEKG